MHINYKKLHIITHEWDARVQGKCAVELPPFLPVEIICYEPNMSESFRNKLLEACETPNDDGRIFVDMEIDECTFFYKWALMKDRPILFDVYVDHPFWILHDLMHAEHDVSPRYTYYQDVITTRVETTRCLQAFELIAQENLNEMPRMQEFIDVDLLTIYNEGLIERATLAGEKEPRYITREEIMEIFNLYLTEEGVGIFLENN
jgi:hypothetical protein